MTRNPTSDVVLHVAPSSLPLPTASLQSPAMKVLPPVRYQPLAQPAYFSEILKAPVVLLEMGHRTTFYSQYLPHERCNDHS